MDFGILRALKTFKNHPYVNYVGLGFAGLVKTGQENDQDEGGPRRKSKLQLIRLSAAVCGIELCYAAETAFVSPILLKLGVPVSLMTMIWCLSPVLGFFLVPVMGSLSDRCPLALGRRRPFILVMSVGIVLGLVLVPNGEALGLWMGDNGTAALHHPKFFAPLNFSSKATADKRSVPCHLASRQNIYRQATAARLRSKADNSETFQELSVPASHVTDGGYQLTTNASMARGAKSYNDFRQTASSGTSRIEVGERETVSVRGKTPGLRRHPKRGEGGGKIGSLKWTNGQRRASSEGENGTKEGEEAVEAGDGAETPEADASDGGAFRLSEEHFRGIILTILGVALLDFNCDACQSPCRAYLLDVSIPEDHSSGLTMFTVMAGLGGTVGYIMGGIDWNATSFGEAFGGHIRVVFTLVIAVFIGCVASTATSFKETPLSQLGFSEEQLQKKKKKMKKGGSKYRKFTNEESSAEEDEADGGSKERSADNTTAAPAPATYGAVRHRDDIQFDFNKIQPVIDHRNQQQQQQPQELVRNVSGSNGAVDDTVNVYHAHDLSCMKSLQLGTGHNATDVPEADREVIPNGLHSQINDGDDDDDDDDDFDNRQRLGHSDASWKAKSQKTDGSLSLDIRPPSPIEISADVTLRTYLRSIVHMPRCLWVLCLVNLFCWMSLVCYSLYFTDFVGQAVFQGDPQAPPGSQAHNAYDDGVRLGSFGMSLYSLSCSVYSLLIEKLVRRYKAKSVYVTGQLVFTLGMAVMAAARHKVAVLLLSPTAGIMYATLFTMPYLLVAHYHTSGLFTHGSLADSKQVRGLGTDVAIISSMVFLAQFLLSVAMGTIIYAVSSTTTVIVASAVLSTLGAITATQVTYLDL